MISYLLHRMEEFGIRPEDLAASLEEDARRIAEARYRNSNGDTWDGRGDMPQWLRQAVSAGQSLGHFAVTKQEAILEAPKPNIDWSQDPFAGSRLARVTA
ncbi:H-NS histone family [Paraburkholderia caribensis MBA4]|uniref:H-NS histone family n=2 Tax=Paraburkholderia caribensis TaxID=75105 RepID=A0A0P0RIK4_9BURK|nr:H-NS histone family [Paraburkholderia caribensis MBA4]